MISLIQGNALHIPLANQSVQCVITSPPYYGLRDYGVSGQIGLEETPEAYTEKMVQVFREVWRVLRDDGTLWLNMGDSYFGDSPVRKSSGEQFDPACQTVLKRSAGGPRRSAASVNGLKPKDMIGIPWRLAFALRADGWYLRSDVIWHKPNPMPESVTDRPTKSHEYVFLLSKSQRYYYDQEAIREQQTDSSRERAAYGWNGRVEDNSNGARTGSTFRRMAESGEPIGTIPADGRRNKRTVWTIPTSPYKGSHFATFPPDLVEPCLLAGTSERGCCPMCGAPWERVVEKEREATRPGTNSKFGNQENDLRCSGSETSGLLTRIIVTSNTTGWRPSCSCPPADPIPCTVLDPFAGTFTVGMVAMKHRRSAVGIELNPKYIELARKRCSDIQVVMPLSPAPGED